MWGRQKVTAKLEQEVLAHTSVAVAHVVLRTVSLAAVFARKVTAQRKGLAIRNLATETLEDHVQCLVAMRPGVQQIALVGSAYANQVVARWVTVAHVSLVAKRTLVAAATYGAVTKAVCNFLFLKYRKTIQ